MEKRSILHDQPERFTDGNPEIGRVGSKLIIGQTTVREQNGFDGFVYARVDDTGRRYLTYALSTDEFTRGLQAGFGVMVYVPHAWSESSVIRRELSAAARSFGTFLASSERLASDYASVTSRLRSSGASVSRVQAQR